MVGPHVLQINDTVIYSGIAEMGIPSGGAHVRAMGLRLPVSFLEPPAVTATVRAITGPATVGVVYGIWSVEVTEISPGDTQVVIHAANVSQEGHPHDGDFLCDYVIIGKRLLTK